MEYSSDFTSWRPMLFEYVSRDFEAISHSPLSRDTLFFYIQLAVTRRKMYEMIWKGIGQMIVSIQNLPPHALTWNFCHRFASMWSKISPNDNARDSFFWELWRGKEKLKNLLKFLENGLTDFDEKNICCRDYWGYSTKKKKKKKLKKKCS